MSDSGFLPDPSPSPYAPAFSVGNVLADRYRVVQVLGQGGFGRTYQAVDTHRFDEPCVLKEFAPQVNSSNGIALAQELFQREAGVLYRLNHAQIPRFREIRQTESGGYSYLILVQDFVAGPTYRDLLRQQQQQGAMGLSFDTVANLLKQLLPVLEYLHRNGVIHRDISPANLIQRQADGLPVLIDFGAVKKMVATVISQVSQTASPAASPAASNRVIPVAPGTCIGKQGFAPPEQFQSGQAYPHSDLYALGATALNLLTGREPGELIDPGSLEWQLPDGMDAPLVSVLRRMVALRPSDRYPSAASVLQALQPHAPSVAASPTPPSVPLSRQPTRAVSSPNTVFSNAVPPSSSAVSPVSATAAASNVQPVSAPPPAVSAVAAADYSSPITPNPRTTSPAVKASWGKPLGCAGVALVLLAGGGLLGRGLWQSLQPTVDSGGSGEETVLDEPAAPPAPQLPPAEQARKQRIWERQAQLGVPETFLNQLVNDGFYRQHPELKGRKLSRYEADAGLRDEWDALAFDWLDTLEALPGAQRQKLGSYSNGMRDRWIKQINQKRLGSRALHDLVAVRIRRLWPDLALSDQTTGPQAQLWRAIAAPTVAGLVNGEDLKRLRLSDGQAVHQGQIPAAQGIAHVIELKQGQTLQLTLDSEAPLSMAFYPPRSNQAPLLPLSEVLTWEGTLDVDGFYEVVVIAGADGPVDYNLALSLQSESDDADPSNLEDEGDDTQVDDTLLPDNSAGDVTGQEDVLDGSEPVVNPTIDPAIDPANPGGEVPLDGDPSGSSDLGPASQPSDLDPLGDSRAGSAQDALPESPNVEGNAAPPVGEPEEFPLVEDAGLVPGLDNSGDNP